MKGFILAAGFGTRLWPLTEDRTKAAVPFLNRPLISYSVEYLVSHGIREIIVNLHHQPDSIRDALEDGSRFGARITYSYEQEILGTSGALDRVRELLLEDDFIVINGKIVTNIDLGPMMAEHRKQKVIATLALKENVAREHFSIVEVDDRSRITRFAGFPEAAASQAATADVSSSASAISGIAGQAPLMFTGIQVLSPRIFDYVPRGCFSHSTIHVYPQAITSGETVAAHVCDGDWYEMSTISRYLDASLRLSPEQNSSVILGKSCAVEGSVEESVLWDRVVVERGARVRQCVIADDVRIPGDAVIERSVVVRRHVVNHIEYGEVAGDNLVAPIN